MAYDKLVDSSQLNSDLGDVADAIRAKSGGSSQLAFPSGFISEIGNISTGGGGSSAVQVTILTNVSTLTACYQALKTACIEAVGDVPFIARYISGSLDASYNMFELRYLPEAIANYYTPATETQYGAYVWTVRSPYNGYFDIHRSFRESELSNSWSYNIKANAVYNVVPLTDLYPSV